MIIHTLTSHNYYSHVLLIVMQELGYFDHFYFKSLMKSQNHETKGSMKLVGGKYMIKVHEVDNTRPIFMSNSTN